MSEPLSVRIKAAQDNLNVLRDALANIVSKDDPDADDAKRGDELPGEIEAAVARISSLERQERALAVTTQSKPPTEIKTGEIIVPDRKPFALPKSKTPEPGDYMYRALAAWSAAESNKQSLDQTLRQIYPNDDATGIVLRAAVNPAQTTVAGWASELIQTAQQGFLDRLIPDFIYPALSSRGSKYTFGQGAGAIRIPTRTNSQLLAGAWVAEAAPKPVKRMSFSSVTLSPYKLAVISVFSEEMGMYSTPAIEGLIRGGMSNDTGVAMDAYLTDAVAVSAGVRPAGLLNGVTPLTATASGTATEKMIADMKQLKAALIAAGSTGKNIVLRDATLHMEDTTPLAIGTAGAPATIAAPTQSLFQTDCIAIRLSLHVSWSMLRTGFVQTIASVGW
jgi:HK97 family phage major capsid protein